MSSQETNCSNLDSIKEEWNALKKQLFLRLILFVTACIAVFFIAVIIGNYGEFELLRIPIIVTAPIVPLLIGAAGLYQFGRYEYGLEDGFRSMNLLLALGLFVMTLAEISIAVIPIIHGGPELLFTVGLLQVPSLLLWAIGIMRYLDVCGKDIVEIKVPKLLTLFTIISIVLVLLIRYLNHNLITQQPMIEMLVCIPLVTGSLVICMTLGTLVWVFRRGLLAIPLTFSLLALGLFAVHEMLWCGFGFSLFDTLMRALAVISYILIGISIWVSRALDSEWPLKRE